MVLRFKRYVIGKKKRKCSSRETVKKTSREHVNRLKKKKEEMKNIGFSRISSSIMQNYFHFWFVVFEDVFLLRS